jgi:hypothetical protein
MAAERREQEHEPRPPSGAYAEGPFTMYEGVRSTHDHDPFQKFYEITVRHDTLFTLVDFVEGDQE